MRVYCSDECKMIDWNELHKNQCRVHLFSIPDFIPVVGETFLGRGTYGEVQLVKHKTTGQYYALKEIKKYIKERKVPIKMLFREISVQKKLIHPNIIRLYDHLESVDKVVLILEYAESGNLFTRLKKKMRIPEREAYHYFSQLCRGLQYLHENKIIHRDIKPENILLTKTGGIKICDFGWCAIGSNNRSTYCGTLDYMAPEILNGSNYCNKVDIWSLGILLYEILQGTTPFKGKSQLEKLGNINKRKLEYAFSISQAAKNLIDKLLSRNPSVRPDIFDIFADEWMQRYSNSTSNAITSIKAYINSPTSEERKKQVIEKDNEKDEFDLKLSQNYPASYARMNGNLAKVRSQQPTYVSSITDCSVKEDSNSNKSSLLEEYKQFDISSVVPKIDLIERQKELDNLLAQLEGNANFQKKPVRNTKSRGFFSKMMNVIGIN